MHIHIKRPSYFESCTDPRRWRDVYRDEQTGEEKLVLTPDMIRNRGERNDAYADWLRRFSVSQKQMIWQVIQVLSTKHTLSSDHGKPWWDRYQDCLFRVFVQPHYSYDEQRQRNHGWYILSPEDCYMTHRFELEEKYGSLPPRDYEGLERFISADKRLRKLRMVPIECCRHWRHETTAGRLPEGL